MAPLWLTTLTGPRRGQPSLPWPCVRLVKVALKEPSMLTPPMVLGPSRRVAPARARLREVTSTDELFRARTESTGAASDAGARFTAIERLVDAALAGARAKAVNE